MPKITEYPKARSFDAHDVLLKDGTNGTKQIEIEDFINDVSDTTNGTAGKLANAGSVETLGNAFNTILNPDTFQATINERTYIDNNDGKRKSSAGAYCTSSVYNGYGYRTAVVLDSNIYEYKINYYNSGYNLSSGAGYANLYTNYRTGLTYLSNAAPFFVVTFRRIDQSTLSNADLTAILAALSCYRPTDQTLTKRGMAADAQITGDKLGELENTITSYPITNQLFPKNTIGLANSDSTPSNKRLVDIRHNYITVRPNTTNPSGSTYETYLISGENPHYLATTISNAVTALTEDDFISIDDFSAEVPLYMFMTKITNASSASQDARIHFVTRNPDSGVKTNSEAFILYNSGAGASVWYKLSDHYLQSIMSDKCLAVLLETRHPYVNADIKLDIFQSASSFYATYAGPLDGIADASENKPLPKYWKDEINTSIASIRANQMAADYSSSTICYITDCHWAENKKYSPRIVKDLISKCNIDYFVNGGDFIVAYNGTKEGAVTELWNGINAFRNVGKPMITLYGNHDRNRDGNPNRDDDTYALTRKEHLNIVYKSFLTDPGPAFYTTQSENTWDLVYWEDKNYRYVLTYWYNQSTSRMPASLMAEMFDTTKKVIVFNHGIYFTLSENLSEDTMNGEWLLADCEPYKDQIKCFIQGHSHADGLRWAYDGAVPVIILDCDTFKGSPKGIAGTASEQCVSVITFNQNNIKIVRIGRGLDLEITSNASPFIVRYTDFVPSIVECT